MFYQGSLQEGISTAVGQQKLVLCFVTNENDESHTWEHEYLQDSSLLKLIETQAVALRLIADSEEAGYLSQIFPLPKTPTVVIMKHGELKEYISAGTSKEDFLRRILVAFNAAPPAVSAAAASSSSLPSPASSPATSPTRPAAPVPPAAHASVLAPAPSTSPPPPSQAQTQSQSQTQAPPASVQAAAQSEIVNRILAERAAKLKAQKEEAERKAKEERAKAQEKAKAEAQAGANTGGAKVYQQAEELKKKRLAEQEERRRILKRIEDDKEERRMRASAKEQQKIESQKADDAASSAGAKLSKLPSTTRVSEMASIQVRLFDGSTIRSRFKTASPLKEVRRWVDENRGEGNAPYTFKQVLTPLPNKNIDATEEGKALGELGLVPSSTLVLIPVQKYSSAYSAAEQQQKSFFSKFLAMILGFFTWLLSLVGLGGGQREAAREGGLSDATARTASEERNRRVRGLQNLQRDHQLYNGNSLNFEPRPDDEET
ncbi:hypothetical protein THARTR1_09840 [Trichoderma harzianum]|uniref:UBX domain-containing protein 2 n=1 Tax=Trichoderma harzianum TaxID=5544 RepID=A0A2K0TVG1_TRIHA|nr:hypothetical protein THARTR1_09840 [Trichoderma harzianum]